MKNSARCKVLWLCGILLATGTSVNSQMTILHEQFGTDVWQGNPSLYPFYSSDALFSGDTVLEFPVANSGGYAMASGGAAVLLGSWNGPFTKEFVMQFSTQEYTGVRLSFGIKHNSNGWGTCQLTNNFTTIEYSTDSLSWTEMDKANLVGESYWPCADDGQWAYVELAEILPSGPELYIRFTHTSPEIHPFYLDDITLSGFLPDDTPPTAPGNLRAEKVGIDRFILSWSASRDENGIHSYRIFQDGSFLLSTADTMARVEHQTAGSSSVYSVYAVDPAGNISSGSQDLEVTLQSRPPGYTYSWERSHVRMLPGGDMEWKPDTFTFEPGGSIRYIDYEGGNDTNNGLTKSTPWKHHPWDRDASGIAAACEGVHTYVFKRGVVYRGVLTANSSGTPLEPIRLTSDPSWGSGEAWFYGSRRLTGGWTRASAATAPNIPEPEKVWYMDIDLPETKIVCELDGDQIRPLHVARSPNYRNTPDDPLKSWWTWTGKSTTDGGLWLTDRNHLVQNDPAFYQGATVFSQEDANVMCTVWNQDVSEWDPANDRVRVPNTNFGGNRCHYYIENTPFLLDTTSEFYYDQSAGRLFVRLSGERDPNMAVIEVAEKTKLIDIKNRHDIQISGLSFGFTTAHKVRYGEEDAASTIRISGICHHIDIRNNRFYYVNGGISLNNTGSAEINSHAISICDNELRHIGDLAIVLSTSQTYIDDAKILRNKIYRNGYRHQGRWYSSIPAIYGQLNYGEVAGNIIDESWGNGIDMFWGKGGGSDAYIPFIRGFIYQNKASNTLIGTNDYGGIESWQGGPVYCFNNYSHNASGYKHFNNQSIGYAYYFDGAFKHVVFNNIASGVSHNRNAAAIMQVLGYYNIYANNTAYNTQVFFNAWKGTLGLVGQNTYLANLGQDVKWFFRHELETDFITFESYGYNVASGSDFLATLENRDVNLTLEQFSNNLQGYRSQLTQTGWHQSGDAIPQAAAGDFRPLEESRAIDRGVRFFTAFPLSRVVGEWNFYRHPADSSIIMGDNFYMTEDFNDRTTYHEIPMNRLKAHGVTDSSFVKGALEDWTEGALQFDGSTVYCSIDHSEASAVKSNNVDMTVNDFIVEACFRCDTGHTEGVLVSKNDGTAGYELDIDATGHVRFTLFESGAAAVSQSSEEVINDGSWHHVLVEVVRNSGIRMYVNGEHSPGNIVGTLPDPELSLGNGSDLLVGKNSADRYFSGTLDFLRLSKGSLADARTTIHQLYRWQTDGPFLYDMRGRPAERTRDVGALETYTECSLLVSADSMHFEADSSSQTIFVSAEEGVVIGQTEGDFFSVEVVMDSLEVTVDENRSLDSRSGSFTVTACGAAAQIVVTQEGAACMFLLETDTIRTSSLSYRVMVPVSTNGPISVQPDQSFVQAGLTNSHDSIWIEVAENPAASPREAAVEVEACHGTSFIRVIQEGMITHAGGEGAGSVRIFPNPVTGSSLHVVLPPESRITEYTICDLSGRPLQAGKIGNQRETIKLDLNPGSYLLHLKGSETEVRKTFMIL